MLHHWSHLRRAYDTIIQYIAWPSPPQDRRRSQVEHKLFNLILDMAEKGREEFNQGMSIAVKEWLEAGILREQETTSLAGTAPESNTEDQLLARLRLCKLQETKMSVEIVARLQKLVQTDGSSKRMKSAIRIDLISGGWLNSSRQYCFFAKFFHIDFFVSCSHQKEARCSR